ncbi:HlyD family type I secretion periplasmic adaptor subunit [Herbaspirillum sp. YR522]|uniref:HlyD family type I secretion periplasmic adaptor subunit n=1 Tax=Herbaspirillum sp. YR522 TaxID=1144342 RepID=UPI00026FCD38|nr:HlyD family type I secretion periplasmic adaptor subunit [Herbaspirillum sp. YR522]EJN07564.1 type I secretion membrane fusion protein, HlyD family [Herbaspirillum sp. YR522]
MKLRMPRRRTPAKTRPGSKVLSAADAEFAADLQQALLGQRSGTPLRMLLLIAAIVVLGLCWAAWARVEEVTQASARVILKSREQVIQSLEGGLLAELKVDEGDIVEKGQILLKIDPKRASALYRESYVKATALKAMLARLQAEAYQRPLVFPEDVHAHPDIEAQERSAFAARRAALADAVAALERSYALSWREIELSEPLAQRGLMSQIELLKLQRHANELRMQIAERRHRFQNDAAAELAKVELELSQTSENLAGRADVMQRTEVQAPVRGVVKNIRINTIGGVIQPGEHIMEIVPLEEQLLVEAKVKPADVAFLRPGLPATIKLSAYDFAIYGGLKGRIQLISPDTLRDDSKSSARGEEAYYRVLVLTDSNTLEAGGKSLPIIPGMTGTVEIRTGGKTILGYLLKPIFKAKEAFRER